MRERVVVVGTGSAGRHHLDAFRAIEGIEPVAVTARGSRREALRAAGWDTAADIREAVESGASRAVIATNTDAHVEDGRAAMEAGCDVLVEKPLSVDAKDAQRLVVLSASHGRKLYVGCVLRFSESLNAFRSMLCRIGGVHAVHIECRSYLPDWRPDRSYLESYSADPAQGGVLRDLIHEIDYAGWLFGWPEAMRASLGTTGRLGIQSEETADLFWTTPGGCRLTMSLDYVTRPPRRRMAAFGERGTLEWDGISGRILFEGNGGTVRVERPASRRGMFIAQARAFLASTGGSADSSLASGIDGVRALAVCDAARKAAAAHSEQRVVYP